MVNKQIKAPRLALRGNRDMGRLLRTRTWELAVVTEVILQGGRDFPLLRGQFGPCEYRQPHEACVGLHLPFLG